MLGHILSGKITALVMAGAVATGGAAAATVASTSRETDRQNGPVADENGKGNGQGAKISALARSIPGGPGKGAIISAAARGHGHAVSADAKKKNARSANAKKPSASPAIPATPATPAKPENEKP